jgi:DNA-binding LacI/PurR family transcriptional regulator
MKQVAERAGVSTPVVSMVLSGAVGTIGVSEAKAQRVREVAVELGYRADWKAASLRKGRTRLVGLLSAAHIGTRIHDAELVRGLDEGLSADDCHLTFASVLPGKDDMLRDGRFDGCLLDYVVEPRQIEVVRKVSLPCVIINARGRGGVPCVRLDQRGAAETAVRHLVDRGHRRICFVGIEEAELQVDLFDRECHADRLAGFTSAVRSAGLCGVEAGGGGGADDGLCIERLPQLYHAADRSPRLVAGLASVRAMLRGDASAPTAFVAYDQHMAVLIREGLSLLGMACPDDYSLVSLQDSRIFESLAVPITSLRADYALLGHRATTRLLAQIEQGSAAARRAKRGKSKTVSGAADRPVADPLLPPPDDEVVPFDFIERASVGPPRPAGAPKTGQDRQ